MNPWKAKVDMGTRKRFRAIMHFEIQYGDQLGEIFSFHARLSSPIHQRKTMYRSSCCAWDMSLAFVWAVRDNVCFG